MKKEEPYLKVSTKCEFLERIIQRYPTMDIATIGVITQVQSLSRALTMGLNEDLACYSLTEGKFFVLAYLYSEEIAGHEAPGPSDIAENLSVTRGTITGLLDGLERDGYLTRRHDSHDRRALTILMTDKAREFFDDFLPKTAMFLSQAMPLELSEKNTLIAWLAKCERSLLESDI